MIDEPLVLEASAVDLAHHAFQVAGGHARRDQRADDRAGGGARDPVEVLPGL
jgi:hypothetical protein